MFLDTFEITNASSASMSTCSPILGYLIFCPEPITEVEGLINIIGLSGIFSLYSGKPISAACLA